jgi:hypothetical protein
MVKNYKKKRKTKKIRRKSKRIKRKTRMKRRNHTKLIGGDRVRTYFVIGSLSNDAEDELHKIIEMDYSDVINVVFILENGSTFTPKDIGRPGKHEIIESDILKYNIDSKKNIDIDIKAHKFMITSQPPEDKIEMGILSSGPDGVKIRELFSTSNSIIIINGYVKKRGVQKKGLDELDPDRLSKCYKYDENLFLECISQIIPLIIENKDKINNIFTQIVNTQGVHQTFANINRPFYYYFITNLYNTGYTLSKTERDFVEIYLTELDSYEGENDDGPEDWSMRPEFLRRYQKCLRDLILNL